MARRAGNLARMAELQYGKIPELEKQLATAGSDNQKKENREPEIRDEGLAEHNFFLKNVLDESDK